MIKQQSYCHSRIEVIAYFHHILRPMLLTTVRSQRLTDAAKRMTGFQTPMDMLEAQYGLQFLDMTTIIRLGSTIEDCLKWYYQQRMGLSTYREVHARLQKAYGSGVFQRFWSNNHSDVIALYRSDLAVDLAAFAGVLTVQEAMLNRHLYAHRMGVLDDRYIENIKAVTGEDILARPGMKQQYNAEDIYWFRPLERISEYLVVVKNFFMAMPEIPSGLGYVP